MVAGVDLDTRRTRMGAEEGEKGRRELSNMRTAVVGCGGGKGSLMTPGLP